MKNKLFSYQILDVCGIPVKSYESLLNYEIDFLRELELQGIQEAVKMWEFAKEIANSENMTSEEVLDVLEGRNKERVDLLIKYSGSLKDLTDRTKVEDKKIRTIAAFVLANRVSQKFFKENKEDFLESFGLEITPTKDYQDYLPLVDRLPETVSNGLVDFLFKEKESGDYSYVSEEKETQEETEKIDPSKDLGKRSRSAKNKSETIKR